VPIYADESVLDRAGIFIDREQDEVVTPAGAGEPTSRITDDDLEKMSAFKDFIEGLDLDDFDKRK
jgi:hypothetical protein